MKRRDLLGLEYHKWFHWPCHNLNTSGFAQYLDSVLPESPMEPHSQQMLRGRTGKCLGNMSDANEVPLDIQEDTIIEKTSINYYRKHALWSYKQHAIAIKGCFGRKGLFDMDFRCAYPLLQNSIQGEVRNTGEGLLRAEAAAPFPQGLLQLS